MHNPNSSPSSSTPHLACVQPARAQRLLASPVLVSARKSSPTAMILSTLCIEKAEWVEVRMTSMPGVWQLAGSFRPGPEIRVEGLTAGLEYRVEARARGSEGISSWSEMITFTP